MFGPAAQPTHAPVVETGTQRNRRAQAEIFRFYLHVISCLSLLHTFMPLFARDGKSECGGRKRTGPRWHRVKQGRRGKPEYEGRQKLLSLPRPGRRYSRVHMKNKVMQFPQRPGHTAVRADEPLVIFSLGDKRVAIQWTVTELRARPAEVIPIQKRRQPKDDNSKRRSE
jgi:hypothetical protein